MAKKTTIPFGFMSLEDARKLDPSFVAAAEKQEFGEGHYLDNFTVPLKRGMTLLIFDNPIGGRVAPAASKLPAGTKGYMKDKAFQVVQVSSVKMNMIGEYDVRVRDDQFSWRNSGYGVVVK